MTKNPDLTDLALAGALPRDPFADADPPPGATDADLAIGDHVELGRALLAELRIPGTPAPVFADGSLYRYTPDTGVWAPVSAAVESETLQGFSGATVAGKKNPLKIRAADVAGARQLAHDRAEQPDFFAGAAPGVAFANGFVTVCASDGIRLAPHDPANRARVALPYPYAPEACSPRWESFLADIFRDDDDAQAKADTIGEFFGACLLGIATRYQRAIVGIGEGANGKTTLLDVVSAVFPASARAAIPPQSLSDEYQRAMLAGIRLNAISELPERDILEAEAFKAIVSGDPIVGRPIRQAPFTFRPIAGHFFAANALPSTNDLSDGFWRRLVVVRFGRTFAPHEQDATLAATIIRDELPGVTAWMLAGAARLLARGRYEPPASSVEAVAEWRKGADTIGLFFEEATRPVAEHAMADLDCWTLASTVYAAYRRWSDESGFKAFSTKKFAKRAGQIGKAAEHTRRGNVYPVVLSGRV